MNKGTKLLYRKTCQHACATQRDKDASGKAFGKDDEIKIRVEDAMAILPVPKVGVTKAMSQKKIDRLLAKVGSR